MTNRNLARGNFLRPSNIKEGQGSRRPTRRQKEARDAQFESLGFTSTDWNKMSYTWPGDFPIFCLAPGIVTDDQGTYSGLVARCGDVEILFQYGADPDEIKARLDDEIEVLLGHQAEVIEGEIEYDRLLTSMEVFANGITTRYLQVAPGLAWATQSGPIPRETWLAL